MDANKRVYDIFTYNIYSFIMEYTILWNTIELIFNESMVWERYINLDFDSSMLSFQEQAEMLVSTSEMSWKKETVGPLLSQNFSKWKKEMPPTVAMLTESCCKSAMLKGRYEKLAVNVGFWNKAKNLVIISCVNVISFLYAWKAINLMKGRWREAV